MRIYKGDFFKLSVRVHSLLFLFSVCYEQFSKHTVAQILCLVNIQVDRALSQRIRIGILNPVSD